MRIAGKFYAAIQRYKSLPRYRGPIFTAAEDIGPLAATIAAVATAILCGVIRGVP
jgi:hypothetical protein